MLKSEEIERAKLNFKQIIDLDRGFAPAYYYLGIIQLKRDDIMGAAEYFDKSIQYGANDPQVDFILATVLTKAGEFDRAKAAYREAVRKAPDKANFQHDLGILYYRTQEYDQSVAVLRNALDIEPDSSKTMMMLGMAYIQQGKTENAIELVTSLRGVNEEAKAVYLEDLLRQAQAKKKVTEPAPWILDPGSGADPSTVPAVAASSASGKGKMSITGNATFNMKGKSRGGQSQVTQNSAG